MAVKESEFFMERDGPPGVRAILLLAVGVILGATVGFVAALAFVAG